MERELGRGGSGVVYLAREVRLDRLVALKVLAPSDRSSLEARGRFLHEARTAARLSHPHVVPILTVEESGDFVFFSMPFIQGGTLGQRVSARGALSPLEGARVLREIAWALAYSHGQGVVHRDIKPENILLEEGSRRALVTDFGVAAALDSATSASGVMGTPMFMSPEQIRGDTPDARADLYSLGVMGYYVLSGRLPFEARNREALLLAHLEEAPVPIARVAPQIPERLAELVMQSLAKDPARRPQSAEAVAEALTGWLGEQRPVPAAVSRFLRQARDSRPVALLYGTVVGLLIFIQMVLAVREPSRLPHILKLAFFLGLPPVIVVLVRLRALIGAGHDRHEIADALHAAADREDQEASGVRVSGLAWKRPLLRWSAIVALGSGLMWLPGRTQYPGPVFLINLVSVACVVLLADQVRAGERERRRARLWVGPVGYWLSRIAGFGVPLRASTDTAKEHRTEMVIGSSARVLFERLPPATRRELAELPRTVERLEAEASQVRQRRRELRQLDGVGDGTLAARRSSAELMLGRRHTEVVTALEQIRLGLLRLHVGTISLESITSDLGRASELASRLDRLASAQDDVAALLA